MTKGKKPSLCGPFGQEWPLVLGSKTSRSVCLSPCVRTRLHLEDYCLTYNSMGFPHSQVGKESTCNAGDPSSIPGSGRSAGERIGYPLQYSWASLMAQLVKNLPAMQETWVQSLDCEDPLEKGKATHSSILAWRIPWTVQSMGLQRVRHN